MGNTPVHFDKAWSDKGYLHQEGNQILKLWRRARPGSVRPNRQASHHSISSAGQMAKAFPAVSRHGLCAATQTRGSTSGHRDTPRIDQVMRGSGAQERWAWILEAVMMSATERCPKRRPASSWRPNDLAAKRPSVAGQPNGEGARRVNGPSHAVASLPGRTGCCRALALLASATMQGLQRVRRCLSANGRDVALRLLSIIPVTYKKSRVPRESKRVGKNLYHRQSRDTIVSLKTAGRRFRRCPKVRNFAVVSNFAVVIGIGSWFIVGRQPETRGIDWYRVEGSYLGDRLR